MPRQPNFLYFVTDQHRADYLGCYGHPVLKTPNIDAIAAQGTRFDRFHTACPACMPNRASLLTGRYPSVHGLRYNGNWLSLRANTFADVLREGGYRTAHIGKFHVQPMSEAPAHQRVDPAALGFLDEAWRDDGGDYDQELPERWQSNEPYRVKTPYYGFDHANVVTMHSDHVGGSYYQWLKARRPDADALRDRANQLPHDYTCPQAYRTPIPEELYPTAYIRDRAVDYLEQAAGDDQPFFAFVSFPDPHHPFTPPGRYWDIYRPEQFDDDLPYEAHHNPPPPLRWAREEFVKGTRRSGGHAAFYSTEQEVREVKALTAGMIAMIDDAIGVVIEALKRSGRYDDTVIVFNSDHGDFLGDFGLLLKGAMQLQSLTRVPFIWSDPKDRSARVVPGLASTVDIAPTIIARAGLKPYWGIQGQDIAPMLNGAECVRDELLVEFEDSAPRFGFDEPAGVRTLLTEDWRISFYRDQDWGELYHLAEDSRETRNLWDDPTHRETRDRLMARLINAMIAAVEQSPRSHRTA